VIEKRALLWVVTPLCCFCVLVLVLCACCCYNSRSCVCCYSPLTLVFIWDHLCKAWETPKCRDSSQWYIIEIKRIVVFNLIFRSLERGWVQPSSIGTPQRGIGMYSTWLNHRIKSLCHVSLLLCDSLSISTHFTCIIALSLILTLWRAITWRSLLWSYSSFELGFSFH
jgi:hypothetical protein